MRSLEYWFNRGGDVFPPEWKHPVTGMVWSGGKVYGTYFSGDPAWVYAIQWLPASPMLSYLVRDPAFAKNSYENMCIDYRAKQKKEPTLQNFGSGLAHVMLGYVLMYDPQWAAEQMDDVVNDPKLNAASEIAVMYYQAHAMRNIGLVNWSVHGTSPTSMVFLKEATKMRTYAVWNPTTKAETVKFYEGATLLGQLTAPPQALAGATALSPAMSN